MSANQDIQKYKESLKLAWGYNDYNDWPIKFNSIMHLFVTEFTREYLEDFSQLLYQGFSLAELQGLGAGPAKHLVISSLSA